MNEKEVLSIMQHYRHDLANELQVIQGYMSMGKTKEANDKINQLFQHFQEERKLMQLQAPKFALWVTRFNSIYDNVRLTYNIHIDRNLRSMDDLLVSRSMQVIEKISKDPDHYCDIHLTIETSKAHQEKTLLQWFVSGDTEYIEKMNMTFDFDVQIKRTDGLLLSFLV